MSKECYLLVHRTITCRYVRYLRLVQAIGAYCMNDAMDVGS